MAGSGTKVADVFVDIGYDLTNYRKGLAQAKTEGQSLGSQIKQALNDPAGFSGKSPIAGLVADLQMGRGLVPSLQTAVKGLGGELKSALSAAPGKLFAAGLGVAKTALNDLKNIAGQVGKGLLLGLGVGAGLGIAELISKAVQAIPDLISKGEQYAVTVYKIMAATGGAAGTTSLLVASLGFLGESADSMNTILSQLGRNLPTQEKQLNNLGIATRDAGGNFLDAITIIDNVRSTLSKTSDGFGKMEQVIALFGGRGALGKLTEYFQLTDAQMAILTKNFQDTGQILSIEQVKIAENAQRESNNLQGILTGLGATLMTEVGPQIIAFFSTVAGVIRDNAKQIEDAVGSALSFILGLVQGLAGLPSTAQTLTGSLGNVGGATSATALQIGSLKTEIGTLEDQQKAATTSTGAQTSALTAQGKVIDGQIAKLKALDTAQARTYTAGLAALNAQLDAQGKLFDAQDQVASRAATAANLQRSLRDAQEALTKAQLDAQDAVAKAEADKTLSPLQRAQAELDAANSVRNAEEALAQVRQSIADNARTIAEDDRKAQIQGVKDELTAIDKIVSDAGLAGGSSKTALADLEKRRKALTAGGTPAAGSDSAIQLAAVLAAETRVRQQAANTANTDALNARKAELSAETAAVRSAASDQIAITLAQKKAQLAALLAQQKAEDAAAVETKKRLDRIAAAYGLIYGPDGTLQKDAPGAFESFRLAGVNAANGIHDALVGKDGNGGVLAAVGSVVGALGKIVDAFNTPIHADTVGSLLGLAGIAKLLGLTSVPGALATLPVTLSGDTPPDVTAFYTRFKAMLAAGQGSTVIGPFTGLIPKETVAQAIADLEKQYPNLRGGTSGGGTFGGGRAAGGPMWPGGTFGINEGTPFEGLFSPRYPNVVVPAPAMPAFAMAGGASGSQVIENHLYLGGRGSREITDWLDESLAHRRLRRT
jgi:hypothetical protein